jgi:hypothetical protein
MSDWRLKPIRHDDSWQVEDPERSWWIPDPPRQARLDVPWDAKEHPRDDAGDDEQHG